MKISFKSLFTLRPDIDSHEFYIRFVAGLLLMIPFWLAVNGELKLWFIVKEGSPSEPVKINLVTDDLQTAPRKGYLEVNGYPGLQVTDDTSPSANPASLAAGAKTYRFFYLSLHADPAAKTPALAVVKRKYFLEGIYWQYSASEEEKILSLVPAGQQITIRGISGYHGEKMPDEVRQTFEANGVFVPQNIIMLDERASVPSLGLTLLYFVPSTIAFLFGVIFLIPWVLLIIGVLVYLLRGGLKGAVRRNFPYTKNKQ